MLNICLARIRTCTVQDVNVLYILQIDAVVNSSLKLYDLILELRMYANEISEGSTSFSLSFASAVLGLKSSLESLEKVCVIILCWNPFYVCVFE